MGRAKGGCVTELEKLCCSLVVWKAPKQKSKSKVGTKTKPTDEGQKLLHLTPCIACAARAQQIGMHPITVPYRQWCAALGPWRKCYNIIFSHYFFLQFLQIHRSVNLREERESCWSQSEKGGCREKEPIECWGKGRQRMGDSRSSEDTHLPWSS